MAYAGASLPAPLPDVLISEDHFGYQMVESASSTFAWKDATSGTRVYGEGFDDGHTDAVALPFGAGFNYYEFNYSTVYINANGFLGFDSSSSMPSQLYLSNSVIPSDYELPQNFVAPYWDDLHGQGAPLDTGVYYASGSDGLGQYFVIEWHNVLSYNSSTSTTQTMSFEMILYENGNIIFQYKDLNTTFAGGSAGIEDADGFDGLGYLYNQPLNGNDVQFIRPVNERRVKIFPESLSSLSVNRESQFQLQVRNTGGLGADNFQLALTLSDPSWDARLYEADGLTPLGNLDLDPHVETGLLAPGETLELVLRVKAPNLTIPSDEVLVTMTATSELGSLDPALSQLRSVVPSPFALTFREIKQSVKLGVFIEYISTIGRYLTLTDQFPTGGNVFAINNAAGSNYINVWQKFKVNQGTGTNYADIEYAMTNEFGYLLFNPSPRLLTSNETTIIKDLNPTVALSQDGNIGVVWVRELVCGDGRRNYNIFLSILTPTASGLVLDRQNVTNSTICSQNGDDDLQSLKAPRIMAIGNNFHLSWVENHYFENLVPAVESNDIGHAVYSSNGSQVKAAGLLFAYNPNDSLNFAGPAMGSFVTAATGEKIMLAYQAEDAGAGQIVYLVLNPNGSVVQGQTVLYAGEGYDIDLVQLTDGNILIAWTDSAIDGISFMLLRRALTVLRPKTDLLTPDERKGGVVSVTRDDSGHGILTWLDTTYYQRMYYASVAAGGVVTQPMAFKSAGLGGSFDTSPGYGNAVYIPRYRILMPVVRH